MSSHCYFKIIIMLLILKYIETASCFNLNMLLQSIRGIVEHFHAIQNEIKLCLRGAQTRVLSPFCCGDLDLEPMTLKLENGVPQCAECFLQTSKLGSHREPAIFTLSTIAPVCRLSCYKNRPMPFLGLMS